MSSKNNSSNSILSLFAGLIAGFLAAVVVQGYLSKTDPWKSAWDESSNPASGIDSID